MTKDISFQFTKEYRTLLNELKSQSRSIQINAALIINQEVIKLYWHIGKLIIEKQEKTKWEDKFIDLPSLDLKIVFPKFHSFSKTNLKYMRVFAYLYMDGIGRQIVDQLQWGYVTLLIKIKAQDEKHRDITQCIENGWSRLMLKQQIQSGLYERQAISKNKISNYLNRLPLPQFCAYNLIKNPYFV